MRERRVEVALVLAAVVCALLAQMLHRAPATALLRAVPPGCLRVVTWNVGGTGGPAGTALGDADVAHVAAALRAFDFDLACLVELESSSQARAVAKAVGDDVRVLVSPYERPLALLSRHGTLALRSVRQPARLPQRRPRLLATWTGDALPLEVTVAAVHASPWSAHERNAELGALADGCRRVAGNAPRLLLGDFNLEAQVEGRQDVFTDDGHLDLETYGYLTRDLLDAGRDAGYTAQPDRRIDYVLVSAELDVAGAVVVRGQRRHDMDHDPLVVDIRLRARPR